jgi:hypothetical protein
MTQMDADQTVAKCNRLRLPAADGKRDLTDVATAETLLCLPPHKKFAAGALASRRLARRASRRRGYRECHALAGWAAEMLIRR